MKKTHILFSFVFALLSLSICSQNDFPIAKAADNTKESSNIFRIEISRSTYTDEAVVAFFAAASDVYDAYDSDKMFSPDNNYPQTYSLTTDNVIVAINGESNLTSGTERIIPLGFHTHIADNFIFTATNLASFDAAISVYIEDKLNNVMQDLRSDNTYSFSSGLVDDATRFSLHFITPTSLKLMTWTGGTSTTWSEAANWNTGAVPTATDNVYISSVPANQPHITNITASPALCNDLNIYNSASLTIDAAKALTVSGIFTNDGIFNLRSDATGTGSFIDNGNIGGTGAFNVEKYLTDSRWWYVGSPMVSASAAAFGTLSPYGSGKNLLYYDEAGQAYTSVADGATLNTALRGYAFKNFDAGATTVAYTGTLNTGVIGTSANLTRQGVGSYTGYNLVCNPYPSAINWGSNNTPTAGLTKTNLSTTIWYRSNGGFATYNCSGDGIGANGGQQYIPAMQAFWVYVETSTTGGLELANTTRVHNAQPFYKNTENSIFRLEVSRDSLVDETVVGFFADAFDEYDPYDSEKMFSTDVSYPQIYTLTDDSAIVVINGQSEIASGEVRIIPLGFVTYTSGSFTLQATNLADFDTGIPVFLEDLQLSTIQDMRENDAYTFSSGNVSDANRFRLHFGSITTGIADNESTVAIAYSFDNAIYVNTPDAMCSIELYDMIGNLILSKRSSKGLNVLPVNINKGVYIVKIQHGTKISTAKVMII